MNQTPSLRMKTILCTTIFALVSVLLAEDSKSDKGVPFTSREHGFAATFPIKSVEGSQRIGSYTIPQIIACPETGYVFFVAICPRRMSEAFFGNNNSAKTLLDGIQRARGEVLSMRRVEVGKSPCVELIEETSDNDVCRYRVVHTDLKTFCVTCIGPTKDDVISETANVFFDSFSVLLDAK